MSREIIKFCPTSVVAPTAGVRLYAMQLRFRWTGERGWAPAN